MPPIPFAKLQATGNDYILVEASLAGRMNFRSLARQITHRKYGVGADGLLLLSIHPVHHLQMRIINPDGSEAEMCGNGIRCFALYVWRHRLARQKVLHIHTRAGLKRVWRHASTIWVDMGELRGKVKEVLFRWNQESYPLYATRAVGNPHAVLFVEDEEAWKSVPLETLGSGIENLPVFPRKTNVEIVNIRSPDRARVRVWERGVGETLACGSGACAIAYIGHVRRLFSSSVRFDLPGGSLRVCRENGHYLLGGDAHLICEGTWMAE